MPGGSAIDTGHVEVGAFLGVGCGAEVGHWTTALRFVQGSSTLERSSGTGMRQTVQAVFGGMTMARLVLENVGVSLAVASLWFFGMPVLVQWSRGGGVVVRDTTESDAGQPSSSSAFHCG